MNIEVSSEDDLVVLCVYEGEKFGKFVKETGMVFGPVNCDS